MSAGKILTSAVLLIFINSLLNYFFSYQAIEILMSTKYLGSNSELTFVAALLDVNLNILENLIVLASILILSFILGFLIKNRSGVFIGISATLIMLIVNLFIISKYLPNVWNNLATNMIPTLADYLENSFIYCLLISCSSGIGAVISDKYMQKYKVEVISQNILMTTRCPRCGAEFKSNPLYCSKCGNKLRESETIEN